MCMWPQCVKCGKVATVSNLKKQKLKNTDNSEMPDKGSANSEKKVQQDLTQTLIFPSFHFQFMKSHDTCKANFSLKKGGCSKKKRPGGGIDCSNPVSTPITFQSCATANTLRSHSGRTGHYTFGQFHSFRSSLPCTMPYGGPEFVVKLPGIYQCCVGIYQHPQLQLKV